MTTRARGHLFRVVVAQLGLLLILSAPTRFALRVAAALGQETPEAATEPQSGDEAEGPAQQVIPPGQEELLAAMFGRGETLPGDCRFDGGQADGPIIRGTYKCAGGEVVFELHHPSDAPSAATQTTQFAIVVRSGSPPPGLTDALAARIRARESAFVWKAVKPASTRSPLAMVVIAVVIIAGIATLVALWRRRARSAATQR